ncbi:carbohydrate ABC transporter permease [Albidovulum sediminis]|uniref:Sugar ABC transporter permease n=1 Tax=Albidovulum sediminis TaxID=3066345 RepID=A0ABT2NSU7_9RHOB|nr:sugar ABC transporter permease [Defluviimonas sediminis]MCT8332013.1 sugar ABC transporter permease [Defluviimonas sediminis]
MAKGRWPALRIRWHSKEVFVFFCLAPVLLFLTLTSVLPSIVALGDSLTNWNLAGFAKQPRIVGLANYTTLLGNDPQFWGALRRTAVFVLVVVPIELVLGLAAALCFDRYFFGRRLMITLVMIPTMIAPVVVAMLWRFILAPSFGAGTYLLQSVGLFKNVPIFSDPATAWLAIMLIDIWEWTPFMMLIMIAGLSSLPSEPIEAARIDGAKPWQILWHVQLPMLRPLIVVAVLFRAIDASKMFDAVYVLTGGGPGTDSTSTITFFAHKAIFGSWKLGYGSAICMVLGLMSLIAAAAFNKIVSARKEPA